MNDREMLAEVNKDIERLELRNTIDALFIYLSENGMLVVDYNGPISDDELTRNIDRFLTVRGDS